MPTVRTFDPNPHSLHELHRAMRQIRVQVPPATYDQTRAPLPGDDITQGWRVGSKWITIDDASITDGTEEYSIYECASNASGNAVWRKMVSFVTTGPGGVAGSGGLQLIVLNEGVATEFALGTDDQVIIADSAETLGVRWGNDVGNWAIDGYEDLTAISTPANPSVGTGRFFTRVSGSNIQLVFRSASGTECVICDIDETVAPGGGSAMGMLLALTYPS